VFDLYVTTKNIKLFHVHNYFVVNLCQNNNANNMHQFLKNNIPTNFQSIYALHIKAAVKKNFICSLPSLEAKFFLTDLKDR
jgi:hypothetical protein